MNSPEQVALQEAVKRDMIERGWQAEDDPATLSEYAVIMLINGKPEDQVDAELSEIIPDYDFGFSKWLFAEAERIASGIESATPAPPAPASPIHRPISPPQSPPQDSPNGPSLKRQRSSSPTGANKAPRTSDAPLAPRAMRDRPLRGRGRERSLLERMGPRPQQKNDEIQARIDAITGGNPGLVPQQPGWQGAPMPMGPGSQDMAAMEMQKQWQDMMAMQMAMMQQMAMMNGGMPFMPGGVVNPNMQATPQRADNQRGRGRGRGRGGSTQAGQTRNDLVETPALAPPVAPTPAPVVAPAPAPALKPTPAPVSPATLTTIPGTLCKFGLKCTNPMCHYAHPSPVATVESGLVLSEEICPDGKNCKNPECVRVHPSPANAESKAIAPAPAVFQGIMCRFGANCTRPDCVFAHPWNKAAQSNTPCRYGIACTRADCVFSHPQGRSLPSAFHKGLDNTTTPSKLNGAAAPFVSKNITQTFNTPSVAPPATEVVSGTAGSAGAAVPTLGKPVDPPQETAAKVETAA
ncbi:hypothetical protein DACRYDRAFT_97521 [Dacryopinax primogenitus]|uniref:Nab2 type CCCH zinc finger 4 domain-containing protein n=1 Tax=Dacryopinax primogenitus (strain DJM 731) TaxID=1858805 RepID=M5FZ32_DACPD|nr:uncharacterized protein DACRYDRAFT_97521 [Dacryopinax primogenitus]EJT96742.1 hypothetical protein DACRYDRAFT_97521 [Dacryopinax primogenitus]